MTRWRVAAQPIPADASPRRRRTSSPTVAAGIATGEWAELRECPVLLDPYGGPE